MPKGVGYQRVDGSHKDTVEAWRRIMKDMAPGFMRNRERQVDKEVERISKMKDKQDKAAGIKRRA